MFNHEINPYPISDKVTFRNVDQTITLTVRSDAPALVVGMKRVMDKLSKLNDEAEESEQIDAARFYARTLFGDEQGDNLVKFYNDDALAIVNACGICFQKRLVKKITKAQKKK